MNAPYIRFELTFEHEEMQVGFITGLSDIGMEEEEVEELLAPFNGKLALPPYYKWENNGDHYPGAYFTREGYVQFKDAIERVIDAVKYRDNGWDVMEIQSYDFPEKDLYYEDEHQAIVKTYYTGNLVEFSGCE